MTKEIRPPSSAPEERPHAGRDGAAHDDDASPAATHGGARRHGETSRQLQEIIEASPLAIITLDREGLVRSWNPAAERIYGWTEAEVLGQPLPTVPPEMRDEMERNHEEAVRGKNFVNYETRRRRKDGSTVEVSISTAPLIDDDGRQTGVVALVADITERKRAEAERHRSEVRFRTLVEQSPLSKQIFSTDGRTVQVNRAWEKLWGVTLADLPDYNILEDEQLVEQGVMPYIKRGFAGEATEIPEIGYVPDRGEFAGQQRWVRAHIYPVKGDGGEVREVVLVHEDVTERRRAEANLFQFASIVENSDDAIISKDLEGTILSWNPGAERLYGYTAAEAIGQPVTMLIPSDRPDEEPRILEQIRRSQRVTHYDTVRRRKDGSLVHVSLTVSPLKDATGRVTGASKIARDITEHRRAEDEKLRLAAQIEGERRRLKELVANVPGVVWEAWGEPDASSQRIDFVSDYVERMLGYTVEEWLQTPNFWLTIVHPEDRERAAREARRKFDTRAGGTSQFRWVRKDGRVIDVESQSLVICDERGQPVGMRGVTMDITERKAAAEAARENERRLQDMTDTAPVFIAYCDTEARFLFVNQPYADRFNLDREAIIGRRIPEVVGEEAYRQFSRYVDAALAGRRVEFEIEIPYSALGRHFIHAVYAPRFGDGGEVRGFVAVVTDVTERRREEEEQKFLSDATTVLASSLDYAATLEAVAHMASRYLADYCLVDLMEDDGAIRRLVAAHRDPAREAAWRAMQQRFPVAPGSRHTVVQVLETGEPDLLTDLTGETLVRAIPDAEHAEMIGQLGVCSAMTVPLKARGRIVGAISLVSAESGRRYIEDDLRLAEELARRAALAVDNARLYQRAQEANRAKDEFLATLSHELRTPLTPIIGWVHLLGGAGVKPADFAHGLDVIDKNSQALSRLINDLLDMSAILSGKMRIDRAPVSVETVLREAVETVRAQADRRQIEIDLVDCDDAGAGATVSGDRTRLAQVFWNLLTNAVKFSAEGARVRVSCEHGAGVWRVRVEDEGVGIASEFLPHVFDRFRQADMSTTKLYGGLGIGLALVRSFVETHGGTVRAESAGAGRGSRFTVSLPTAELRTTDCELRIEEEGAAASATEAAATSVPAASAPTPSPGDEHEVDASHPPSAIRHPPSPRRILVVEDAPDTLEMLRLFFSSHGFAPILCASSEEALDVAAREHFDIIVTDIGLPHIDGYELLRRLRRDAPHLADAPALALTGYAAETDVTAARAAGFDAHLAKPFDPAALAAAVERLLAGEAERDAQ
ncbi:MAG: PAS domain S-box protein [Pyrinomonadaceae bacterium]